MKEVYRNPIFFYILAPFVIGLWPLLIWSWYLPATERSWEDEKAQYEKSQGIISDILALDPERLDLAGSEDTTAEFDYANAVDKVASSCEIPSTDYKLNSGIITSSGGQKSQSAQISIKQIDIKKFAEFLSTLQLRWANLQCTGVKLTKKKGLPDTWDVGLDFKYYY